MNPELKKKIERLADAMVSKGLHDEAVEVWEIVNAAYLEGHSDAKATMLRTLQGRARRTS